MLRNMTPFLTPDNCPDAYLMHTVPRAYRTLGHARCGKLSDHLHISLGNACPVMGTSVPHSPLRCRVPEVVRVGTPEQMTVTHARRVVATMAGQQALAILTRGLLQRPAMGQDALTVWQSELTVPRAKASAPPLSARTYIRHMWGNKTVRVCQRCEIGAGQDVGMPVIPPAHVVLLTPAAGHCGGGASLDRAARGSLKTHAEPPFGDVVAAAGDSPCAALSILRRVVSNGNQHLATR